MSTVSSVEPVSTTTTSSATSAMVWKSAGRLCASFFTIMTTPRVRAPPRRFQRACFPSLPLLFMRPPVRVRRDFDSPPGSAGGEWPGVGQRAFQSGGGPPPESHRNTQRIIPPGFMG